MRCRRFTVRTWAGTCMETAEGSWLFFVVDYSLWIPSFRGRVHDINHKLLELEGTYKQNNIMEKELSEFQGGSGGFTPAGAVRGVLWRMTSTSHFSQDAARWLLSDTQTFVFTSGCKFCACVCVSDGLRNSLKTDTMQSLSVLLSRQEEKGSREGDGDVFLSFSVTDRHKHIISDRTRWTNIRCKMTCQIVNG